MKVEYNDPNDQEMGDAHRAAYLIAGYIRHTLTDEERIELDEWVTASDDNMRLFAEMTDEKNIEKGLKERNIYDADKAIERLKLKLQYTEKKRPAQKLRFLSYGIAASLLLLAGIFIIYNYTKPRDKPVEIIADVPDLQPGGDKATLTISGGQKIILDTAKGNIIQEGDFKVVNMDGKISYEGKSSEAEYHTLSTPKGGQYKIILPDETAVWLNAASSLKYPVTFTGAERVVKLTGEGYFEVAKDATKKFIVNINNKGEAEVLGTHFNVNTYDDEAATKITLLEGSVKVSELTTHHSQLLKPGQQIALAANGQLTTSNNIDPEEVIAWKNGLFEFKDASIETIMLQVARWYDVTIIYEGKVDYHFNASIERKVPVSKLFHLLELTERVHFTIKDKTIIVKP